jgi:hypothetical protein
MECLKLKEQNQALQEVSTNPQTLAHFRHFSSLFRKLCVDNFPALPAHPYLSTVLKVLKFDAHRIYALVTHQHHVGPMDRSLFFYNTPLSRLPPGLGVTFNKIHIFNDKTVFVPKDFQDFAHLTLFLARNNFDFVILLDAALHSRHNPPLPDSG